MKRTHPSNSSSRRTGRNEDSLREIAERSAEIILGQLPPDVPRRDPAEVRGYVRARAAAVVREQMADAMEATSPATRLSTVTWNATVDRAAHLVLHRLWSNAPAPQARRAA